MIIKRFFAAAALLALSVAPAIAQGPRALVEGVPVAGGTINWNVYFVPESDLFADASGGSLAVEGQVEFRDSGGGNVTSLSAINGMFMETIEGTVISNPGDNPYSGIETEGLSLHAGVGSVISSGTVDGIFAALGSTKFTTESKKLAFSFSSDSFGGSVELGGMLAQDGQIFDLVGDSYIVGDANDDGVYNNFDVIPLIQGLTDPAGYAAAFPGVSNPGQLDVNQDGVYDNFDVIPAINILTGAGSIGTLNTVAVPEPTSLVLGGLAIGLVFAARRRQARV